MGSEFTSMLWQMGRSLLWALVAAVSFAFSMGLTLLPIPLAVGSWGIRLLQVVL